MIRVTVGNSLSSITGLTVDQMTALRKELSYLESIQGGYRKFQQKRIYLIDRRSGVYGSGLGYIVDAFIAKHKLTVERVDTRIRPTPMDDWPKMSLPYTPYPEQVEAAEACRTNHIGVITAPTALGKSAIIALITEAIKVPTIIVVPSLNLKIQLIATLSDAYGEKYVGPMKDRKLIAVENIAAKCLNKTPLAYKCLIVDEVHHSGAETYRKLSAKAWGHIFYRFGLTATFFRSQENQRLLLESFLSNVIYEIPYDVAISKGYLCPVEAYYIEIPPTKIKGKDDSYRSVYNELVVENKVRNQIISDLMVRLSIAKKSTLVLVKQVNHGTYLTNDGAFLFANGENKETDDLIARFNKREIDTLIGTSVIQEGTDTKPAEYIILAGLGKSKNLLMQVFGRGFRLHPSKTSCKIIIFLDRSHLWTVRQFKVQRKILKEEYGCVLTEIKI